MMLVSSMVDDASLPEHARESLAMIRRNVDLETQLIDEMLDLTRLNSGKISLRVEELDVSEIMSHVCEICRPHATERRIHVNTQFDPKLRRLRADPVRLRQAFWNVLKNAIKFTMAQGRIEIITAQRDDGWCEVRVQDNGIGMRPETLGRIFDVFEQADPAITQQFGGLGLGLAITKALVELHEGRIRAESDGIGKGTCVVMELPN
jgi:signal transduction histidine kinase